MAWVALIAALAFSYYFGVHSYRSYLLLQSATAVGAPDVANIRAWMTLGYVAGTYDAPYADLAKDLDISADTPADTPIGMIAGHRKMSPLALVQEVQAAVAELAPEAVDETSTGSDDAAASDTTSTFLSALLAYSYPALGVILLLGAIGFPVPTGFSTVLAGSLAALGDMDPVIALSVVVSASVAGDIIGYSIGLTASDRFLARRGPLIGFTPNRRKRVDTLFRRWGGLTVLLTRTLVSHLSSIASLLAGISRYNFSAFLVFAVIGRILWAAAYFGLGYIIGNDIEAASTLLANITGLLLALGTVMVVGSYLVAPLLPAEKDEQAA